MDLKRFSEITYQKKLMKINDRIYHFFSYGHSNATAIVGENSIILVDTLDSDGWAREMKNELEKISDFPVKTIIYTHSHPDHRGGAGVFKDTVEEIIEHAPIKETMPFYEKINDGLMKRGIKQHGYGLNDEEAISQGIGLREGKVSGKGQYAFLSATTVYTEPCIKRNIDGVEIEIYSAPGETEDQIYVWLPFDQVMCCGNNYYGCFPALYAIRGSQYRDLSRWVDSLTQMLAHHPRVLLPGHTKALVGEDLIQNQVGTFRDAIDYILHETLACINQGFDLDETIEMVKLPKEMATQPYLQEYYGMVAWAVKSVYCGYVGWFDGNPTHLVPVAKKVYQTTLLELIGKEVVIDKIKTCMAQDEYQLALELLEMVDEPWLKKECLIKRAEQMTSANARHYLLACAKEI